MYVYIHQNDSQNGDGRLLDVIKDIYSFHKRFICSCQSERTSQISLPLISPFLYPQCEVLSPSKRTEIETARQREGAERAPLALSLSVTEIFQPLSCSKPFLSLDPCSSLCRHDRSKREGGKDGPGEGEEGLGERKNRIEGRSGCVNKYNMMLLLLERVPCYSHARSVTF